MTRSSRTIDPIGAGKSSPRSTPTSARRHGPLRVVLLLFVALAVLVTPGCRAGAASGPRQQDTDDASIGYSVLPVGYGRGFPLARVASTTPATGALVAGTEAPDFAFVLDDGRKLTLSDLRGRPVMLNFWATWCPLCRAEMPEIVGHAAENEDIVVIAVNVQEDLDTVRAFAEEYDMQILVARDADGRLRDLFHVRGMPTSIFIDRDGNISSTWAGMLDAQQLTAQLSEIL